MIPPVNAQNVQILPSLGSMISTTPSFIPPMVRGITIYPNNPFQFDFIIDAGDNRLQGEALEQASNKLIKYFLSSLTVPEKEMWVNLSPYEEDRIIAKGLGRTEMGRDLLAQDYILKQLTASLIFPESELGKEFWQRVYAKAQEKYGTSEIPMNTFNKIWIVPDKATVYVNGTNVFVSESHLSVMLEEDYLALENNSGSDEHGLGAMTKDDIEIVSGVTSHVVREILIPEIEKEVNNGEHFGNLRQIYNAMILATWYKKNLKNTLLGQTYIDQNRSQGVDLKDKEINQKIYDQYVKAFEKGVFDFIREDYDDLTQQVVPRKYFSGGLDLPVGKKLESSSSGLTVATSLQDRPLNTVSFYLDTVKSIDNLRRLINILTRNDNVPELSADATEDKALEYILGYLGSKDQIAEERNIENDVKLFVIKDEVKNTKLGRAIRNWVMERKSGAQAINFPGVDGTWKIVGFEGEINEQLALEIEEVIRRKRGEHWIVAMAGARGKQLPEGVLEEAQRIKGGRQGAIISASIDTEKVIGELLNAGLNSAEAEALVVHTGRFFAEYGGFLKDNQEELLSVLADPKKLSFPLLPVSKKSQQDKDWGPNVLNPYAGARVGFINNMDSLIVSKIFGNKLLTGNRGGAILGFLGEVLSKSKNLSDEERAFIFGIDASRNLVEQGISIDKVEDYTERRGQYEGYVVLKITLKNSNNERISLFIKSNEKSEEPSDRQNNLYESFFYKLLKIVNLNSAESAYYFDSEDDMISGITLMEDISGQSTIDLFQINGKGMPFRLKDEFVEHQTALIREFAQFNAISDLVTKWDRKIVPKGTARFDTNYRVNLESLRKDQPALFSIDHGLTFQKDDYFIVRELEEHGSTELAIVQAFNEFWTNQQGRKELLSRYKEKYFEFWKFIFEKQNEIDVLILDTFGINSVEYQLFKKNLTRSPQKLFERQEEALLKFVDRERTNSEKSGKNDSAMLSEKQTRILKAFGVDNPLNVRELEGGGASEVPPVYLEDESGRRLVLRRSNWRNKERVLYTVSLVRYVRSRGLTIAPELLSLSDSSGESTNDFIFEAENSEFFILEEFKEEGEQVSVRNSEKHHHEGLGRLAAELNNIVYDFTPEGQARWITRKQIEERKKEEFEEFYKQAVKLQSEDPDNRESYRWFIENMNFFRKQFDLFENNFPEDDLIVSPVHNDLFSGNVKFDSDGRVVGLFDFEFAQTDLRVMDFNSMNMGKDDLEISIPYYYDKLLDTVRGYDQKVIHKLSDEEIRAVIEILRLRLLEDVWHRFIGQSDRGYNIFNDSGKKHLGLADINVLKRFDEDFNTEDDIQKFIERVRDKAMIERERPDQVTFLNGSSSIGGNSDDSSVASSPGGIDLNPSHLDLQTDGKMMGLNLPLNSPSIQNLQVDGYEPIIFNIVPTTNLPFLLGEHKITKKDQLSRI